jgi:hypothetical protein
MVPSPEMNFSEYIGFRESVRVKVDEKAKMGVVF